MFIESYFILMVSIAEKNLYTGCLAFSSACLAYMAYFLFITVVVVV
jgi:hypothetical protein